MIVSKSQNYDGDKEKIKDWLTRVGRKTMEADGFCTVAKKLSTFSSRRVFCWVRAWWDSRFYLEPTSPCSSSDYLILNLL